MLLDDKPPALVSPWYIYGNIISYLGQHLDANRNSLAVDVVNGLEYLHSFPVSHGDLKGENVLVDGEKRASLCDFGMSQFLDEASRIAGFTTTSDNRGGTDRYMCPELLEDMPKTTSTDMWALGCLLIQILADQIPYQHITRRHAVLLAVVRGEPPFTVCPDTVSTSQWDYICKCWSRTPEDRPLATELRLALLPPKEVDLPSFKASEGNSGHGHLTLYGYSTLKPPVSERARMMPLLKSEELFNVYRDLYKAGGEIWNYYITYAYIAPGYLLFQRRGNPRQLQIRQLGLPPAGDGHELDVYQQIVTVAFDDSSQRLAYITKDNQGQYLLYLNTVPAEHSAPGPLFIGKKVDHIFWINSSNIGLIMDDDGLKNVYQYQVTSGSINQQSLGLLFTLRESVREGDHLYHSVVSDGEEEWIAINMSKGQERYVQVWSRKLMTSLVVEGVGTITRLNLGGEPLILLITADQRLKERHIFMVTYILSYDSIKEPYKIFDKRLAAMEVPGDHFFVHVFEEYGIGLIVNSRGGGAALYLFDVYTGEYLQSMPENVMWKGISRDLAAAANPTVKSSATGLLVLDTTNKVHRLTIDEELLNKEWR
ncbi:hypothetical protein FRC02_011465 [Tulasnella sp. 418]|nr:hypothetical protein FRC02_011465 [Tulasnella sp. 418]